MNILNPISTSAADGRGMGSLESKLKTSSQDRVARGLCMVQSVNYM